MRDDTMTRRAAAATMAAGLAAAAPRPAAAKTCRKKRIVVQPEIVHALYGTVRIQYTDIPACVVWLETNQGGPVKYGTDGASSPVSETALIPGARGGATDGLMYQIAGTTQLDAAEVNSWSILVSGGDQDGTTGVVRLDGRIVAGELGAGEVILSRASVIAFPPPLPPLPPMPDADRAAAE